MPTFQYRAIGFNVADDLTSKMFRDFSTFDEAYMQMNNYWAFDFAGVEIWCDKEKVGYVARK